MTILNWIKESWLLVFSWPVIVLIIALILLLNKNASQRLSAIFRGFKSFKLFGAEFVLSEENAKQVSQSSYDTFKSYRNQANVQYKRLIEVHDLRSKMEQVLSTVPLNDKIFLKNVPGLRCTIHIPDVIFTQSMYQLMDYYPSGGGSGRAWSFRYGIIGKAWRSGESTTQGSVSTDEEELISKWGMTREEASAAARYRKSFSCVILRDEHETAVAIFYMDSTEKNAFGMLETTEAQKAFHDVVSTVCDISGLIAGVVKLRQELLAGGSLIDIYG